MALRLLSLLGTLLYSAAASHASVLLFPELVALSRTPEPTGELARKVDAALNTVYVNNGASERGIRPHRPAPAELGPAIRVAAWNVERGNKLEEIRMVLAGSAEFRDRYIRDIADPLDRSWAEYQLSALAAADVLVLNEVDLGVGRTDNRDVAGDLAASLDMNYAFGAEFIEVDPEHLAGADPANYRGLHGTAILSRYPILRTRMIRLPSCYDWYRSELRPPSALERGRRWSVQLAFQERVGRELRHGGRMALIVELGVPEAPGGRITVVGTHLENRGSPRCRQEQLTSVLRSVADVTGPLVLAGDMNTTGFDSAPMTWRSLLLGRAKDPGFWTARAVTWFTPTALAQPLAFPAQWWRNYADPTARHIPFVIPNAEQGFFRTLARFRFKDGGAFDLRGDCERTLVRSGKTLANSNERAAKGFVPTYTMTRPIAGAGKYKLDWIFVRAMTSDPRAEGQSYRLAPHFPMTMRELNEALPGRMSDHHPITVDLPLREPSVGRGCRTGEAGTGR